METEKKKVDGTDMENCWEFNSCQDKDCPAYGRENAPCWEITGHRCRDRVFPRVEEKLIQCCFNCPFFKRIKERAKGRRWVDITLLETMEDALKRSSRYSNKVEDLYMEVIRRSKLMNLLGEVSRIIARLDKEEDIMLAILTVITAKEGLGFNRAFVFMHGPELGVLRGKYALGPSTYEEAENIWKILDRDVSISLEKLVSKGQKLHYLRNSPLTNMTRQLALPTSETDSIITKGMYEVRFLGRKELHNRADIEVATALGLEDFCVCPIATDEDKLGLLIVDNIFTGKKITAEDAHLLEMITSHASTSLRAAQLKESLDRNVRSLKDTYRRLKMNEERMMKAERLAISGELTSSVIHEIKNPLVAIGGFARNLYYSQSLNENDRNRAEIIMKESLRLEKYLEKLQMKVGELNLEEVDINQVLEDGCQLISSDLESRNIDIVKSFDPDLPSRDLDIVKIHEVILNILQNALDAVDKGGHITVRSKKDEQENVVIEVQDDGVGINENDMERIFTPFFTTKDKGSGLGLAFANKIIKAHRGDISVTSSTKDGTTVRIEFPPIQKVDDNQS
jgi:signal transduction histidine kinase